MQQPHITDPMGDLESHPLSDRNCIQTLHGHVTHQPSGPQGTGSAQKPCVPPTVFQSLRQRTVQDVSRLSLALMALLKVQAAFPWGSQGTPHCHWSDKSPGKPGARLQRKKNNEQSLRLCYFPSAIVSFSNEPGEEAILTDFPL